MKRKILVVALLSLAVLTGCGPKVASPQNLDPAAFQKESQQSGVVLLDVRTPAEFSQGHIKGAINLDVEATTFDSALAKLNKSKTYAVYCHSGRRSAIAVAKMSSERFNSLYNLENGIQSWLSAGLPIVVTP